MRVLGVEILGRFEGMKAVLFSIFLLMANCSFCQAKINIDSLQFNVEVNETIDTAHHFVLTIRTEKIFPTRAIHFHHSASENGTQFFYTLDSITQPQSAVQWEGPASDKIDLGQISMGRIQIYFIKNRDTSLIQLTVNKDSYTLKNADNDFVINISETINRIPRNFFWGNLSFLDKEDAALANEYVSALMKAGAIHKKLKRGKYGRYDEFNVSKSGEILPPLWYKSRPIESRGHIKMYALFYDGDFDKIVQIWKAYADKANANRKEISATMFNDRGERYFWGSPFKKKQ